LKHIKTLLKLLSHFSLPTFKSREKTWSHDFFSFIGTHPQLPRQQQPSQRQQHFPLPSVHQHHLLTLLVVKHLEIKKFLNAYRRSLKDLVEGFLALPCNF
jgi:hypothetical protein